MKKITLSVSACFIFLAGSSFGQEQKLQTAESIPFKEKSETSESSNESQSLNSHDKVTISAKSDKTIKERPVIRTSKEKKGMN